MAEQRYLDGSEELIYLSAVSESSSVGSLSRTRRQRRRLLPYPLPLARRAPAASSFFRPPATPLPRINIEPPQNSTTAASEIAHLWKLKGHMQTTLKSLNERRRCPETHNPQRGMVAYPQSPQRAGWNFLWTLYEATSQSAEVGGPPAGCTPQ